MGVHRFSPKVRYADLEVRNIFMTGYLYVPDGAVPYPAIRYNDITSKWQFSNDGVTFYDMGSGLVSGSAGDNAQKIAELIYTPIAVEDNHTIPGGFSYITSVNGDKLDVFLNGQLLTPRSVDGQAGDYSEIDSTTLQFHINVVENSVLTYIIKQ